MRSRQANYHLRSCWAGKGRCLSICLDNGDVEPEFTHIAWDIGIIFTI